MASEHSLLFIQTGGTIDKDYPKTKGGFNFEIGNPAIESILSKIRPGLCFKYKIRTVCQKDSLEITDLERSKLLKTINESSQESVIITHGTDSIIETAIFLAKNLIEERKSKPKIVILTGAFLPEKFKETDADFNLGMAIGAIEAFAQMGTNFDGKHQVFVTLNGRLIPAFQASRREDGSFVCKNITRFS